MPCTISGAMVLGRTWRTRISGVGVPTAIAASTYGSSRTESTTERTRRTTRGISGIDDREDDGRAGPAPQSDTSASASRMPGIAIRPSMTRMTTASSQRM